MNQFHKQEEHLSFLKEQDQLPRGFKISTERIEFYPQEKSMDHPLPMDLTLICLDQASPSFAAMYTRNALPGHPVTIGKELMKEKLCKGILVNNKIANVCTHMGKEDSLELKNSMEALFEDKGFILPCSTGIIGWKLPRKEMLGALPSLKANLQGKSLLPAAKGIMTTDAFPKIRSIEISGVRISAIAKGAGMIEPNLATMLVYILTDGDIPKDQLQESLELCVSNSFNRISIDSDQSTSDTVFALSSCQGSKINKEIFQAALEQLCMDLADDIVRNGEGTGHVIELSLSGAPDQDSALGMAKAIINSPLTKTAIFGNDPNVGRILQAIGDYGGNSGMILTQEKISISLGGVSVLEKGIFNLNDEKEIRLNQYLKSCSLPTPCPGYPVHGKRVELHINLGMGSGESRVLGSDLSYEYVRENADYRS